MTGQVPEEFRLPALRGRWEAVGQETASTGETYQELAMTLKMKDGEYLHRDEYKEGIGNDFLCKAGESQSCLNIHKKKPIGNQRNGKS